jgi:hypothetical protein
MFDLEDEHHLKLYEYLKQRSNGSSYIRTLIHSDMTGEVKQQTQPETIVEAEPIPIMVQGEPLNTIKDQVTDETIEEDDDIILDGIL